MNYLLHIIVLLEIYLIISLSLNLMIGYTGLLSLAHAAFYGIGAYISTLLMVNAGWDFLPALIAAISGALILSLFISYASILFKGDYFILITLAFQIIIFSILYNWVSVTRGPYGIPGIPKPIIATITIDSLVSFAIFGLLCAIIILLVLTFILRSPFGRTLKTIRDDELAASALGKNIFSYKIKSVAIASGCAAFAGALYATYITYIDPTSFNLNESILMLSMVIVGGTGNIKGPLVGAVILILLPEVLRFVAIPDSFAANVRLIIYGLLLIILMYYRPQGIAGNYKFE
jgi:branched-chain amino acid transport system permease protein